MKYQYKALDQAGARKDGMMEAPTEDIALVTLQNQGLVVTDIKEIKAGFSIGKGKISLTEVAFFSRQLGVMISARVSLTDALKAIMRGTTNPALKERIFALLNDLTGGLILSKALARHPEVFSEFFVEMVGAAEITGTLSETLNYLADYYENQARLMEKFKSALTYPIIVIAVAFIALIVVFGFVIPQIGTIFEQANIPMPFITAIFLGISKILIGFWWLLLAGGALGVYLLFQYIGTPEGKMMMDYVSLQVPVFGNIFKKLYIARFLESFKTLLGGGITVDKALSVSASIVENALYEHAILQTVEDIKGGKKVSESLQRTASDLFPPLVIQLIETGESTGELTELLTKASQFYQEETDRDFNNITELIQSLLIVFLGGILGLMEAAILIPIFTLTRSMSNL